MTNLSLVHDYKAPQQLFGDFLRFGSDDWIADIPAQVATLDVFHSDEDKRSSNILIPTVELDEILLMLVEYQVAPDKELVRKPTSANFANVTSSREKSTPSATWASLLTALSSPPPSSS